jgi:hypothetical protein
MDGVWAEMYSEAEMAKADTEGCDVKSKVGGRPVFDISLLKKDGVVDLSIDQSTDTCSGRESIAR